MTRDTKPSLAKAIQTQFAPTLRRDGFSGTARRYWRVTGGQCQVVHVQGSQYGGEFAVNLAMQPMSIPLLSGALPEPKHVRETECIFRRRLARSGADQWWDYQPNQASVDAAVRAACVVYEEVGRGILEFIAQPESPLNTLTPEAFAAGTFDFGLHNTGTLMAWTLARMRKATGDSTQARGFARIALKEIGDAPVASELEADLTDFLESLGADD